MRSTDQQALPSRSSYGKHCQEAILTLRCLSHSGALPQHRRPAIRACALEAGFGVTERIRSSSPPQLQPWILLAGSEALAVPSQWDLEHRGRQTQMQRWVMVDPPPEGSDFQTTASVSHLGRCRHSPADKHRDCVLAWQAQTGATGSNIQRCVSLLMAVFYKHQNIRIVKYFTFELEDK